jgi:hypothetical protein
MTKLIAYHHFTTDLALFESDGDFWIGSYFPQASHQNGEPPYCLIRGYFKTECVGLAELQKLRGDEI